MGRKCACGRATCSPTAHKCRTCYREIAERPLPPALVPIAWGTLRFWLPIDERERSRIENAVRHRGV